MGHGMKKVENHWSKTLKCLQVREARLIVKKDCSAINVAKSSLLFSLMKRTLSDLLKYYGRSERAVVALQNVQEK